MSSLEDTAHAIQNAYTGYDAEMILKDFVGQETAAAHSRGYAAAEEVYKDSERIGVKEARREEWHSLDAILEEAAKEKIDLKYYIPAFVRNRLAKLEEDHE